MRDGGGEVKPEGEYISKEIVYKVSCHYEQIKGVTVEFSYFKVLTFSDLFYLLLIIFCLK